MSAGGNFEKISAKPEQFEAQTLSKRRRQNYFRLKQLKSVRKTMLWLPA